MNKFTRFCVLSSFYLLLTGCGNENSERLEGTENTTPTPSVTHVEPIILQLSSGVVGLAPSRFEMGPSVSVYDGGFVTPLVPNTVVGDTFPLSLVVSVSEALTGQPELYYQTENLIAEYPNIDCADLEYRRGSLCTLTLRVTPKQTGRASIDFYIGDQKFTSETVVSDSAIVGYLSTKSSQQFNTENHDFLVGEQYPLEFVYVNFGQKPAHNINIETTENSGTLSNVENTCQSTLAPGSACHIYGFYEPTSDDSAGVQYRLTYDEGEPVVKGAINVNKEKSLIGRAVRRLPMNIAPGTNYDVEFQFKNLSSEPVSNLETALLGAEVTSARSDTCVGTTLQVGEACSIVMSLSTERIGTVTAMAVIFNEDGVSSHAVTSSSVVEASIIGDVSEDLPQVMGLGTTYHYTAVFTNTSETHDATGIRLAHLLPNGIAIVNNTCDSVLEAQESCHILVETTATEEGLQRVTNYLFFDQGTAVVVNSTLSEVAKYSLSSRIDRDFPSNMVLNHQYPFHITYTNTSVLDTGIISLSSESTEGLTLDYDSCSGESLSANESCQLSGQYTAKKLGSVRLENTLGYGSNQKDTIILSSEVVDVPVEGKVKVGLPQNTALFKEYDVAFSYRNFSTSQDVTDMDITISGISPSGINPVHITKDTCSSTGTLGPGEECELRGVFKAQEVGLHQFSTVFRYAEGNAVKVQSATIADNNVEISAAIDGASALVVKDENYAISYRLTNESSLFDATDLSINTTDNLTILSNTCGSVLKAGSHCNVEARFSPNHLGHHVHTLSLHYSEGEAYRFTQSVRVVELIEFDELVFETGSLTHSIKPSAKFDELTSRYGLTIQTVLQTADVAGNPETITRRTRGDTVLDIALGKKEAITFSMGRYDPCVTTAPISASHGCFDMPPTFYMSLAQEEFDSLPTGEQSGALYLSLTQPNNEQVALFKLPIRVKK